MRPLSKVGRHISKKIGIAIHDYRLIRDGDRILIGVSGGKDSLTLAYLLNEIKKWAPVDYSLLAVNVEDDYTPKQQKETNRRRLKEFFEELKIPFRVEKIRIADTKRDRSCFWCSWNRRKALFLAADRLGFNRIALAHTKDDIIETLMLNMLYHGEFSAMNPLQKLFKGKIVIIRPLCYVEENLTRRFAREQRFPVQAYTCPRAEISKRRMVKRFIRSARRECSYVKDNIFRSMFRVKRAYIDIKRGK